MLKKLRLAWQLWRTLGTKWLVFRLSYALQMRSGLLEKRMPLFEWTDRPLKTWLKSSIPSDPESYRAWRNEYGAKFFFSSLPSESALSSFDKQETIAKANAIIEGKWQYFSHTVYDIDYPPNWHLNPLTGKEFPSELHWTKIDDFGQGDIKFVWEASRFACVYTLARAYAFTSDEHYPEAFWLLVEDWAHKNPPNRGSNWKCGQEASFRVMAFCFGFYAFSQAKSTTAQRISSLISILAVHAERIEGNINYARSQKNNHGISEGMGLWTIGTLFPELLRADVWREYGTQVIAEEVSRQIYADGSYVQHSANYHRVMLHVLIWAIKLGELNNSPLPALVYEKFSIATSFLYQLLDIESGQVPNVGANDGALILPLSNADYLDYRPVLQAAYYLIEHKHLLNQGPWNEDLLWLFGENALKHPSDTQLNTPNDFSAPIGGYYTLHGGKSWVMMRCAEFVDRPSHADQLHVDLWWRGQNIVCDAGTYLYNSQKPWDNALSYTSAHSTVLVDQKDQMTKVSRFLWLNWAKGRVIHNIKSQNNQIAYLQAMHDGYTKQTSPVLHHREVIRLGEDHWIIHDRLDSLTNHNYCLHWLFPDLPYEWDHENHRLLLDTSVGKYWVQIKTTNVNLSSEMICADKTTTKGWRSRYYGSKDAALSMTVTGRAATMSLWSLFSPSKAELLLGEDNVQFESGSLKAELSLTLLKNIKTITLAGIHNDFLEVGRH